MNKKLSGTVLFVVLLSPSFASAHDPSQVRSDEGVAGNSTKEDSVDDTVGRRPITRHEQ